MKKLIIVVVVVASVSGLLHASPMLKNQTKTGAITIKGIGPKAESLCEFTIAQGQNQDLSSCNPAVLSYIQLRNAEGVSIGTIRGQFNLMKSIVVTGPELNKYFYKHDETGPYRL